MARLMALLTYVSALILIAASLILGTALCAACLGVRRTWAAPAVGFAVLLVLAGGGIRLPGRAATAAILCIVALLIAGTYLVVRRVAPIAWHQLVIGGFALAGASVPFIASGRVGVLGAGLDNDMAVHLLWAEALRSGRMAHLWQVVNGAPVGVGYEGYPLGPHGVVAALGSVTGIGLDAVFTGLMLSVIVLIALAAGALIERERPLAPARRWHSHAP